MSRWLIKYYPIKPAQNLSVWNLDILDCDDYCSPYYSRYVSSELLEYETAITRNGSNEKGYTHYNNKAMCIIEADKVDIAINQFFHLIL